MDEKHAVRLLFGGDFAPNGRYEALIATRAGEIFGQANQASNAADFTIFNLETPICDQLVSIEKSGPAIRASSETLRALNEAGVDAVCLANNHILDYGKKGLSQTLDALQARGIRHVGAGLSRDTAETPLRVEIRGRRISILAFAEREFNLSDDEQAGAAILDPIDAATMILQERSQADAIVVCFHGGNEYFSYPRPGLRKVCQFLIDIGADAVIGHHPHVPGPYEIHQGKPIIYSLGNLIFDTNNPPPNWDEGYLAGLDLKFAEDGLESVGVELIPYRQAVSQNGLQLMKGQERSEFLARIERMRDHLENRPQEWLAKWNRFVEEKRAQTLIDISSPFRFRGLRRLMAFSLIRKLIAPPSRRLLRLNLLRCASHRELLISVLGTNSQPRHQASKKDGD
jgi:capsule synthesis protein PGA_cap